MTPDDFRTCRCGHDVQRHQFQGPHANWPCNGIDGTLDDCGCNGFDPVEPYDPYLVAHLQHAERGRVDPRRFPILWERGQLSRHRGIARALPLLKAVPNAWRS